MFKEYNLKINVEKTEITALDGTSDLTKTKKLGSLLDCRADFENRKSLSNIAMAKYRPIWKNQYIQLNRKMAIYNTYDRPILVYNCSTWVTNKSFNNTFEVSHRGHIRGVLDIYCPWTVKGYLQANE